jgi:hypothetical protein
MVDCQNQCLRIGGGVRINNQGGSNNMEESVLRML